MTDPRHLVATANRLLNNEGVLDAFGHVSLRHPDRPDRYFLAVAKAPPLVGPQDVIEHDLDSEPVEPAPGRLCSERVLHGAIYRSRPDVMAVCHHHAPAIMPFCISDIPLEPVNQLGGTFGAAVAVWDSHDAFGDTNLLVTRQDEADSVAASLGAGWTVLMKRHGALVAGRSLKELVFRAVHGCDNARALATARAMGGHVSPLTEGERALTAELREAPVARCWDYWIDRLDRAGRAP